jgi:DnaJ-class molecular chaperone
MFKATSSLYDVLGVSRTDSCSFIKKAYLKLARVHHPDKGGDPEQFKKITEASDILTDEKKRKLYDETGMTDQQMMDSSAGMFSGAFPFDLNINDLFGNMFGNPPVGPRGQVRKGKKPPPTVQTIPITLEQFYLGHTMEININRQSFCTMCDHTGASSREICRKCNGQGSVTQTIQVGPMVMHTTGPCLDCQGKGERILEQCKSCEGKGYHVEKRSLRVCILPGMRPEETFQFPEVCSDHPSYERPGDAHIMLQEDPADASYLRFKRIGDRLQHLETAVTLSLAESLIGCVVQIDGHPGYDTGLFIQIPAGSFEKDRYRVNGLGMPLTGTMKGTYGHLYLVIHVKCSEKDRDILRKDAVPLLAPLFQESIRTTDSKEEVVQTDIILDSY